MRCRFGSPSFDGNVEDADGPGPRFRDPGRAPGSEEENVASDRRVRPVCAQLALGTGQILAFLTARGGPRTPNVPADVPCGCQCGVGERTEAGRWRRPGGNGATGAYLAQL